MSGDEWDVEQVLQAEDSAVSVAEGHLSQYEPFLQLPPEASFRTLSDYRTMLSRVGISGPEASRMIQNDLRRSTQALRGRTAAMPYLGSPRRAVLLHVSLLLGIDTVLGMSGLWASLRARNFETAAEELLMSNWPSLVGSSPEERRRVLDLVRIMRTGVMSTTVSRPITH